MEKRCCILFAMAGLTTALCAQTTVNGSSTSTTTSPVANVYVVSQPSASSALYAFTAAANGALTPVAGSPYASPVSAIALNGKWLFGSYSNNGGKSSAIASYSIAPNGSLKLADTLTQFQVPSYETPVDLTLDHSGNSLYAGFTDGVGDNGYEGFSINQTNGKLTDLDAQFTGVGSYGFVSFVGNNQYFYGASCYHYSPNIYGFARMSNGYISQLGGNPALPSSPPNTGYCPVVTAADPYNDLVVSLGNIPSGGGSVLKYQLAVYTADKYGNLATTSTYQNMPVTSVEADYLSMSPAGYYLAVTGYHGMQIFLMHGSKPLTALTGAILPNVTMGEAFWDHYGHLYVTASNQLYVFNISTNGITQAPGSPYTIPGVRNLAVLPR